MFDDRRGLGAIAGDDGQPYAFHCTAIADGTRNITAGTTVVFSLSPGHRGFIEAQGIRSAAADATVPADVTRPVDVTGTDQLG
jgi:cold shock CspA family protein